jgi:hypothetical protein
MKVELLDMLDQLAFGPEPLREQAHNFLYNFLIKLDINEK